MIVEAGNLRCVKRGKTQQNFGGISAAEVVNMRKNRVTGEMEPVGASRLLSASAGKPLVIALRPDGRQTLILSEGNVLKGLDLADGTTTEIGTLNSRPLSAAPGNNSRVVIMTERGAEWLVWDDSAVEWTLSGLMPEFPPIAIVATEETTLTTAIAGGTLTGGYAHGSGRLTAADRQALTTDCIDAYSRMEKLASGGGYYMQPVAARYRIKDREGNVLHESSPVLVGNGYQCTSAVGCTVSGNERQAASITAEAWRMGVVAPSTLNGYWREEAATLEILATGQLHPVRMKGTADGVLTQNGSNDSKLTFTMPGISQEEAGNRQRQALTKAAVEHLDELMSVVASFNDPFGGTLGAASTIKSIAKPNSQGAESESAAIESVLKRTPVAAEGYKPITIAACRPPHKFKADSVAVSGDTVLWGNLTAMRYGGYALASLAAKTSQGKWRGNIAVEFTDGRERAVWSGGGTEGEPLTLSPLLTYPSGDAEKMIITISHSDGRTVKETLELTATARGDMAYFLHPTLAPWTATTAAETYIVPATKEQPSKMLGRVLSATSCSPLNPIGALAVSPSEIAKLTPAVKSGNSWDFGGSHFYAFGSSGVSAISVNSKQIATKATLISTIGVDNSAKIAIGPDGVWALSGKMIMKISGSRSEPVVELDHGGKALGWSSRGGGELWVINEDGSAEIIDTGSMELTSRKIETIESLHGEAGRLLLVTAEGINDTADEDSEGTTEVEWRSRQRIEGTKQTNGAKTARIGALRCVTVDMDSPRADIAIEFRGDHGQGRGGSYPLLKVKAKGAIDRPLTLHTRTPRREWIDIKISGRLAAGSVIRRVGMEL